MIDYTLGSISVQDVGGTRRIFPLSGSPQSVALITGHKNVLLDLEPFRSKDTVMEHATVER